MYLKTSRNLITLPEINISTRPLPVISPTLWTKRPLVIQQNSYPLIHDRQVANPINHRLITCAFLRTFTFLGQVIVLDKLLNYHSLFTLWEGQGTNLITIAQSALDHQLRHSQEATLEKGVGGHSCSSGDWDGQQRGADGFILCQVSFSTKICP